MTKCFIIILLLLSCFGCTRAKVNKLSEEETVKRAADWAAAVPVESSERVIGTWVAKAKDMPDGSAISEWKRSFNKDGDLTESIAFESEATGPIVSYRVEKSRLYVSESQEQKGKDQGELRLQGGKLLIKTEDGIYLFHHEK